MKWSLRKTIGVALFASLPIEGVVFFLLPFPIDVGYEPGTAWYIQSIGLPWIVLHLAGMYTLGWIERAAGCHQLNAVMGCRLVDMIVLLGSGYLTCAFILVAVIFGSQRMRRMKVA